MFPYVKCTPYGIPEFFSVITASLTHVPGEDSFLAQKVEVGVAWRDGENHRGKIFGKSGLRRLRNREHKIPTITKNSAYHHHSQEGISIS
jgi:hypothetical protein